MDDVTFKAEHIAIGVIGLGIVLLALGVYLVLRPEPTPIASNTQQTVATPQPDIPQKPEIRTTPIAVQPKKTIPSGPILGGTDVGLHYANPNNSLEAGVAYKKRDNTSVYIYDGQALRPVETEDAYLKFYGCKPMRLIDCAPVYELPTGISKPVGAVIN